MIEPRAVEIGLGLGSNVGDRIANLKSAKKNIQAIPGVTLLAQSSLYETEPVGVKPEFQRMKFINAVLIVRCEVPLENLHKACVEIEAEIGRNRTADRYAPRTLDIDVLFAGDLVLNTPSLKLPHPQCLKRRFVLQPLAEIRPALILPSTGVTVTELLARLPAGEPVVKLSESW